MIIKRSQSEKNPKPAKTVIQEPAVNPESKEVSKDTVEVDVPVNFEDIVFNSRQERRQGSRRRGYRRVDDRNTVSRAQEEANSIREQAVIEGHGSDEIFGYYNGFIIGIGQAIKERKWLLALHILNIYKKNIKRPLETNEKNQIKNYLLNPKNIDNNIYTKYLYRLILYIPRCPKLIISPL